MRSFFVQLPYDDPRTLRSYQFFLVYHGHGYTQADVDAMPLDELHGHIDQLYNQISEERKAQEAAARKARRK